MADSKLVNSQESSNSDLVQCGICFTIIDNPKALPCLHTFCLKCLSDWSKSSAKKNPEKYANAISCPICREDFPLPKGGVKDLKTNFFVNKLKERYSIQNQLLEKDAKIPCTSCDASDNHAVSRCVECNDFLCKKCVDSHKSLRVLKHHHVLSLDELRAGKLTMHNLPEQEMCPKHTGEVLRFYCETCDEPMCRDCTVVDHPRPDHKQIDLKSAAGERTDKLEKLYDLSKEIPKAIDIAVEDDEKRINDLKSNVEAAISQYKKTAKKAASEFTQKMRNLEAKRTKEIEVHKESLQFQKSRLCTALEMTKQVTQNGTEHDIATMFSSLSESMQQLSTLQPQGIRMSLAKVKFSPNEELSSGLNSLGSLNTYEDWALEKTIGSGQFNNTRALAYNKVGDIVVANHSGRNVRVLKDNNITWDINASNVGGGDVYSSTPWGVATGKDGTCFITDLNPYVKVFDEKGNFKHRFGAKNPNGNWSSNEGSQLYGLAIDAKGRVFVGSTYQYISIHNQDGTHISSFCVSNLYPYFITLTPEVHLIVSDHGSRQYTVHVYDIAGTQLHTFTAPPGGNFYPTGICLVNREVLIASYTGVPAIYRYSLTGEYIGVFTKEVTSPWGIALRDDEDQLAVGDNNAIKLFHLK